MQKFLDQWLTGPINKTYIKSDNSDKLWQDAWKKIADPSWPECPTPEYFLNLPKHIQNECHDNHNISLEIWHKDYYTIQLIDANGILVNLSPAWHFTNVAIIHNKITNQLSLNHSNPDDAFEICYSKECHQFIRGKLHKCAPVGLLPEFIQQFPVEISDEDRQLINSYKPADPTWSPQKVKEFVDEIKQVKVIPQCTFCPSKFHIEKFSAGTKKIKIVKL
jgi:hypothetical protein